MVRNLAPNPFLDVFDRGVTLEEVGQIFRAGHERPEVGHDGVDLPRRKVVDVDGDEEDNDEDAQQEKPDQAEIEGPPIGDLPLGFGHGLVILPDVPDVLPGEDLENVLPHVVELLLEAADLPVVDAADEGQGEDDKKAGERDPPVEDGQGDGRAAQVEALLDEVGNAPLEEGHVVAGEFDARGRFGHIEAFLAAGFGHLDGHVREHVEEDPLVDRPAGRADPRIDGENPDPQDEGNGVGNVLLSPKKGDEAVEEAAEERRLDDPSQLFDDDEGDREDEGEAVFTDDVDERHEDIASGLGSRRSLYLSRTANTRDGPPPDRLSSGPAEVPQARPDV